jgi:hypothetical protein
MVTLRRRKDTPVATPQDVIVHHAQAHVSSPAVTRPAHPERICWGCDLYCPADDLRCGNEVVRAMHPLELFGPDWRPEPEPVEEE